MILLTSYIQPPGHCRICQSAVVPVIDTQRDYDSDGFGGVLYICANCAGHMAGLLGWVHPSAKEDYEGEIASRDELIDRLETESADLAAENETLRDAFKAVNPTTPTAKRGPGRPRKVTE